MEIVTTVTRGVNKEYIQIPEGVTHIGPIAFLEAASNPNCKIRHVKLPSTLLEIGVSAFAGCPTLLSVDFSECNGLQEIGDRAFARCTNLRHVNLSNCPNLTSLSVSVFDSCEKLVLHVPRQIQSFYSRCLSHVQCVALPVFQDTNDMFLLESILLPSTERSQRVTGLLESGYTNIFFTDNYDQYADVFDAIGELNVHWVESLRRQSVYRNTNQWNKSIIVAESEIKNRVMELWRRIKPYDIADADGNEVWLVLESLQDILNQGVRLVAMESYQRQPEETKIFKEILSYFDYNEPQRSDGRSKRARRLANLRL